MSLSLFAGSPLPAPPSRPVPFSPLMLADRLIGLAQEADRAGYQDAAAKLLGLVYAVLDDPGTAMRTA